MEIVRKEVKTIKIVYTASDGTEFTSQDECRKYEASASCAIKEAFYKCRINKENHSEWSVFGCGSDEVEVFGVVLKDEKDLYAARVYFKHFGYDKEISEDILNTKLIVFKGDDWVYFTSASNPLNNINNLFIEK